jgi:RHS repeat-associated protein
MKPMMRKLIALLCVFLMSWQNVMAVEKVTYFHNDISGSPVAATDANGNLLWTESYQPYGAKVQNSVSTAAQPIAYTGKVYDDSTGLMYFGARYYDPVLGRFTGMDPQEFTPTNIHSFNRYAYGNNNPYRYVDPDGKASIAIVAACASQPEICIVAATLIAGYSVKALLETQHILHNEVDAGDSSSAPVAEGGTSPEVTPEDLRGKTIEELEKIQKDKGLVQDSNTPNKWRDPVTGKQRIRIDSGHVDPETGKPYENPRANVPHADGYDQDGGKVRDPQAENDPHFPLEQ